MSGKCFAGKRAMGFLFCVLALLITSTISAQTTFVTRWDYIPVPEGGSRLVHFKLSSEPAADVTGTVAPAAGGDNDITVSAGTPFTIEKANWNTWIAFTLNAAADPDEINGTANIEIVETSGNGIPKKTIVAREMDKDGIITVGGTLTKNTVWSDTQHDYHITSAITIPEGVTLTIGPGATVIQDGGMYRAFTVQGLLQGKENFFLLNTWTDVSGGDRPDERSNAINVENGGVLVIKGSTLRSAEWRGHHAVNDYYDDWSAIIEAKDGSNVTISGCTFDTFNQGDLNLRTVIGVVLQAGSQALLNDYSAPNSFRNFRSGIQWVFGAKSQTVAKCNFTDCEINVRVCGDVTSNVALNNSNQHLFGVINVAAGGVLAMNAGSTLYNPGHRISVSGKLTGANARYYAETWTDSSGGDRPDERWNGLYFLDGSEGIFQKCTLQSNEHRWDSLHNLYDDWSALIYSEGASKLTLEGCAFESVNLVYSEYRTTFGVLIGSDTSATIKESGGTPSSFKGFNTGIYWIFGSGVTTLADSNTFDSCVYNVRMKGEVDKAIRMPIAACNAMDNVTVKNGGKITVPAGSRWIGNASQSHRFTIESGGELYATNAFINMAYPIVVKGKADVRGTTITVSTWTDLTDGDHPEERLNGFDIRETGAGFFSNCNFSSTEYRWEANNHFYDDWSAIIDARDTSQLTVEGCSFTSLNNYGNYRTVFGISLFGTVKADIRNLGTKQNSFTGFHSGICWRFGSETQTIARCQFTDCDYDNLRLAGDISKALVFNNLRQNMGTDIAILSGGQMTLAPGSELSNRDWRHNVTRRLRVQGTLTGTDASFYGWTWTDLTDGEEGETQTGERYNLIDLDGGTGIFKKCTFNTSERRWESLNHYYDDWSAVINCIGTANLTVEGCNFESLKDYGYYRTVYGIRFAGEETATIGPWVGQTTINNTFKGFQAAFGLKLKKTSPNISGVVLEDCPRYLRLSGDVESNVTLSPNLDIWMGTNIAVKTGATLTIPNARFLNDTWLRWLTIETGGKLILTDSIFISNQTPVLNAGAFEATNSLIHLRTRRNQGDMNYRNGMRITGKGSAKFTNCTIKAEEYESHNAYENALLHVTDEGSLTLDGSLLMNSYWSTYPLHNAVWWNSTGDLTIKGTTFTKNTRGLKVTGSFPKTHLIEGNDFHGNTEWSIYNDFNTTRKVLIAQNNWWGASTGPTNARNPGGTGDPVSDNVDFGNYQIQTPKPPIIFRNPATGQELNNLNTNASQPNVELFGFRVTPPSTEIKELDFRLFGKGGTMGWAKISNIRLILDANGNGKIDANETTAVGGEPIITYENSDANMYIRFDAGFKTPSSSTAGYILVADFTDLAGGDYFSIELADRLQAVKFGMPYENQTTKTTHFAKETVALSDPAYGQMANAMNGLPTQAKLSLFGFRLASNAKYVDKIIFTLSSINGITAMNMTNVSLVQDVNNNGKADDFEPSVGGTPVVSIKDAKGTIEFEPSPEFVANGTYILRASFTNLVGGNGLKISLDAANITIVEETQIVGEASIAVHVVDKPYVLSESNFWYAPKDFGDSPTQMNFPILGFILFPGGRTVNSLKITLSGIMGIEAGDITNPRLYWDKNGDGILDSGDPLVSNGTVSIKSGAGAIEFKTPFITRADLIVTADFDNLAEYDELTVSLDAANVVIPAGNVITGTGPNVRHYAKSRTPDNMGKKQSWSLVYRSPGGTTVNGRFNTAGDKVILGYNTGSAWIYDAESNTPLMMLKEHYDLVQYAGFNSDDTAAVTVTRDGAVYIWDLQTGSQRSAMFSDLLVTAAVPSPDFSKLMVVTEGKAKMLDLDLKKVLWEYVPSDASVQSIAYSADGARVAVGRSDGRCYLLKVENGTTDGPVFIGQVQAVTGVAFTGDGTKLLTSSTDKTITIWDIPRHRIIYNYDLGNQKCQGATVSRDGTRIALVTAPNVSNDGNANLKMYDENGNLLWSSHIGNESGGIWTGTLNNLAFDREGKRIIVTSSGGWAAATCFDVASGKFIRYWGPLGYFTDWYTMRPRLAEDGKRLFYSSDWGINLLNRETGKTIQRSPNLGGWLGYDIAADGSKILWFTNNRYLRADNVTEAGFTEMLNYYTNINYNFITSSHSGGMVIAGDRLFSAFTGQELANSSFEDAEYASAFSPDSRLWGFGYTHGDPNFNNIVTLASADPSATIQAITKTKPYKPHRVVYHPDGRIGCVDVNVGLQFYKQNDESGEWDPYGLYEYKSSYVALSQDGTMLLMSGDRNAVRLYDVRTGRVLRYFFPQNSNLQDIRVRGVQFANNDSVIMIAWTMNYVEIFERTKATSIELTPVARTLARGESQPFTVEVFYDDTTREDITPDEEGTFGNAILSVIPATAGTFVGNVLTVSDTASGAFIVQARYRVNNKTFTAESMIKVGKSQVVALEANPKKMTVTPGVFRSIRYTATYDDGYQADVTEHVQMATDRPDDVIFANQTVKVLFTANPGDILVQGRFADRYENIRTANTIVTTFGPKTAWERYRVTGGGYGTSGEYSPNGKKLVLGSSSGAFSVYDVGATPSQYELTNVVIAHEGQIKFLGYFAADRIITASDDGNIKLWSADVITSSPLWVFSHSAPINTAVFSPDKKKLVIGDTMGKVGLFDINSQSFDWLMDDIHDGQVNCAAMNANYVITGGADSRVKLLEAGNGSVKRTFVTQTKPVVGVGFLSGTIIAVSEDQTATFWRESDLQIINRYELSAKPSLAEVINNELYIATESPLATNVFNSDMLLLRWLEHPPQEGKIVKLILDPSKTYLLTGRGQTSTTVETLFGSSTKTSTFGAWQFWEGTRALFRGSLAHSFPIIGAHAAADANRIFTQDSKRTMVWNFDPNDNVAQSARWIMETGYYIKPKFDGLDFTEDDSILATKVGVSIYTYKTLEDILWKTVHFPGPGAGPFAISPNGTRMALADAKVRLWDMISMTQIREESRLAGAIDFRRNEHFLGTMYDEKFVGIWNENGFMENGIFTTKNPTKVFVNSTGERASVITEEVIDNGIEYVINYYLELFDISDITIEPPLVTRLFLLSIKMDLFGGGDEAPMFSVAISDDTALALVGASGDRPVKLINTNDGSVIREFTPPSKKSGQNGGAAAVGFTDNDDSVMIAWAEGYAELHRRVRPIALDVALDKQGLLRGDYPAKAALDMAKKQEREIMNVLPGDTFRANSTATFANGELMNVTSSIVITADKPDLVTINGSWVTINPDAPIDTVTLTIDYIEPKFSLQKKITLNIGARVVNGNIIKAYLLGRIKLAADEKNKADANGDLIINVADMIWLMNQGRYKD
ncbi:MAG TPA: hypothetical protein PLI82_02290 [Candidatus Sumerlaeota bacterium]|nr:hypothetical protein [Candidatus Sumerlaeota bacterium]HON49402.1 hypothetical protein [Candidatus Sumerlaeota bacterium]